MARVPIRSAPSVSSRRAPVNFISGQGGTQALQNVARGFAGVSAALKTIENENDRLDRFGMLADLTDFEIEATRTAQETARETPLGATDYLERQAEAYAPLAERAAAGVAPKFQAEAELRINRVRQKLAGAAVAGDFAQRDAFYEQTLDTFVNEAKQDVARNPKSLENLRMTIAGEINKSGLSETRKAELQNKYFIELGRVSYFEESLQQELGEDTPSVPVRQDDKGFWHAPGIRYELQGKTRRLPVSKNYVERLSSTLQAIDPDVGAVIVSGGQARKGTGGARTGSTRHDVSHKGTAETSDIVLTKNGRSIKPGEDKALYAQAIKRFAAAGFTGLGHYPWGIHVGGGSPAFWGPNTKADTADPVFKSAYDAGRKLQVGGLPFDPIHSIIPFEEQRRIQGAARTRAKQIRAAELPAEAQALSSEALRVNDGNVTAARNWLREAGPRGKLQSLAISELNDRLQEALLDRRFNQEQIDDLERETALTIADTVKQNNTSKVGALNTVQQLHENKEITAKQRKAVEERLVTLYSREAEDRASSLLGDAFELADRIGHSTGNLKESRAAAARIVDPKKRAEVETLLARFWAVEKAQKKDELLGRTQAEADRINQLDGLNPTERFAQTQQIKDAELRAATQRQLTLETEQKKTAARQQLKAVESEVYQSIYAGGSFKDWQTANPEKWAVLSRDGQAVNRVIAAEVATAKGRTFALVSDGTTLNEFTKLSVEEKANFDPATIRTQLTNAEFNKAVTQVASSKARLQSTAEQQTVYDAGNRVLAKFLPRKRRNGKETIVLTQEEQNVVEAEMTTFIDEFTAQGKRPSRQELEQFAASLVIPIEADPPGVINPDDRSFSGIVGQRASMSAQQRSVAEVDIDSIPPKLLKTIKQAIVDARLDSSDEDLIEQIAGAHVVGDNARMLRLLGSR